MRRLPLALLLAAGLYGLLLAEPGAAQGGAPSPPAPELAPAPPATSAAPAATEAAAPTAASDEDLVAATEMDLVAKTLPLDLATASFYELADWAASLGLSDSGSAAELRGRLNEYYGLASPGPAAVSAAEGAVSTAEGAVAAAEGGAPGGQASPAGEGGGAGRKILIERASRAEYTGGGAGAGGLIKLSGGVLLSVTEPNGELHRISARELVYDRDRNAVSARGEVVYRREGQGKVEEFTGESLAVDLDDWSGLFLDGRLRREGAELGPEERGLVFTAETLAKRSGDVLVFEGGTVSACDEEDPHYSIRAGTMWFLGGNDWAVADAVLSVGEVPLLWLPFFYYPSEEIVFHPVLGYRSREGRFLQTTTYLRGSKPAPEKPTGLLRLSPETGPTELRGVFLKRTSGEAPAPDEPKLKLLLDLYSGLGYFAGLEGSYAQLGPFSRFSFGSGFGLSRSLFPQGGYYSPYEDVGDWGSLWNSGSLLGLELPLRFGLQLAGELKEGSLALSFALPLYSDPYFEEDFGDRSEDMDWLGLSSGADSTATSPGKRSSFTQRLGLTYNPSVSALSPWLSSFKVSRLDSSLVWQSKTAVKPTDPDELSRFNVDPAREFFYPELQKPLDLALELRGSLLASHKPSAEGSRPGAGTRSSGAAEARSPWEPEVAKAAEPSAAAKEVSGEFRLPLLAPELPARAAEPARPLELDLDWNLAPSFFWEDRFLGEEWASFSDVDLQSRLYRLLSYRLAASLSGSAAIYGEALSASLALSYADQDQFREVVSEPQYAARKTAYELADAQYKSRKLSASLKLNSRPFPAGSPLAASNLSYSLDSTLYGLSYASLQAGEPVYKEVLAGFDADSISSHSAGFSLGLLTYLGTQSLGISLALPPTRESYTTKLGLEASRWGYSSSLSLQAKFLRAVSGGELSLEPVSGSLKAQAPFGLSLNDSLVYDPEEGRFVSNVANLGWGWLSMGLQARRSKSYKPVSGTGWIANADEAFRPTDFSASLKGELAGPAGAPLATSLGLNLSYNQSLLRFSESTLAFGLNLSLKLGQGFSLSFSTLSQNQSAWRYFPEFFPAVIDLPGGPSQYRRPLLLDLYESLALWDLEALKRGLFKLKSLSLELSQDLHDWDLSVSASVAPLLDTTLKKYLLDPKFSITVAWRDIPELKSAIDYDRTGLSY